MSDDSRNSSNFTSRNLLRDATAGDRTAEGKLLDRYRTRLLALTANRLPLELRARVDPEDVVQSACRVFMNRMRDGDVFVQRRGELWDQLVKVTLNKIRSLTRKHHRGKRNIASEQSFDEHALVSREPDPEDAALFIETVDEILRSLPKQKQRKIVVLRLQGKTTKEIATETGFSVERVRQIIRWVKQSLEDRIKVAAAHDEEIL